MWTGGLNFKQMLRLSITDQPQMPAYLWRRLRASWGLAFAWASTVVAAWARICARVRLAVSDAKSVSRMALSAAETFSRATSRLLIVEPIVKRSNAPRRPRSEATCSVALSRIFWAVTRLPLESELVLPEPSVLR